MKRANLFSLLIPVGIIMFVLTTFSNSIFSFSLENNTALEQAQKSLEINQEQSTIVSPEPTTNPAVTDNIQDASKITKLTGSMSKYENSDYGISINFPSNWKPSEVNLDPYVVVLFLAPEKSIIAADYIFEPAGLLVSSKRLPSNMTLSDYIESFFRETYPNATEYRVISSSKDNLGGLESEKIIMYEYSFGSYKVMQDMAIDHKTGTAYWITYSAHPGLFSNYLPLVEQMIDSFKLINSP